MIESPFAVTSRILSEASNSFDMLRIIAGEANKLSPNDRGVVRQAADELEHAQRSLIMLHAQLIETQQRLIAVNEQLIEARKAALPMPPRWRMSTGWFQAENVR